MACAGRMRKAPLMLWARNESEPPAFSLGSKNKGRPPRGVRDGEAEVWGRLTALEQLMNASTYIHATAVRKRRPGITGKPRFISKLAGIADTELKLAGAAVELVMVNGDAVVKANR